DFSPALTLAPQQAEPYIGRGLSYLAVNETKSAASDLDEALRYDSRNLQAWMSRGLAYERLGDKEKAAGSYAYVLTQKSDHAAAREAFRRVGGQSGKQYQTF